MKIYANATIWGHAKKHISDVGKRWLAREEMFRVALEVITV